MAFALLAVIWILFKMVRKSLSFHSNLLPNVTSHIMLARLTVMKSLVMARTGFPAFCVKMLMNISTSFIIFSSNDFLPKLNFLSKDKVDVRFIFHRWPMRRQCLKDDYKTFAWVVFFYLIFTIFYVFYFIYTCIHWLLPFPCVTSLDRKLSGRMETKSPLSMKISLKVL